MLRMISRDHQIRRIIVVQAFARFLALLRRGVWRGANVLDPVCSC